MKSENIPSRMYIPQPFASGDGIITPEVNPIQIERNLNEVNFVDGFPSPYSTPFSQGGKLVDRGTMNALGLLATANEYARACGGITTFDPRLAVKIGGYPRGAVLEIIEGLEYHRVISLVDDNMVDFNGDELTEEQISAGVILGSIDGVNWAYCANGTIDTSVEVATLPNFNWLTGGDNLIEMFPIGTFTAKRSGTLTFDGSYDIQSQIYESVEKITTTKQTAGSSFTTGEEVKTEKYEGGTIFRPTLHNNGFMILCTEDLNNSPARARADVIYSRANASIIMNGIVYTGSDVISKAVTKGTKYALYVLNQCVTVSNSTFKIKIA